MDIVSSIDIYTGSGYIAPSRELLRHHHFAPLHRPRFTSEQKDVIEEQRRGQDAVEHSSQEIAATQETTDAVPSDAEPAPTHTSADFTEQEVAATQETTDSIPPKSSSPAAAIDAGEQSSGVDLRSQKRAPTKKEHSVYFGNLSWETTADNLRELAEEFGAVHDAKVVMDAAANQSKGFGFIKFAAREDAERAVSELNGTKLYGRSLMVQMQKSKESRSQNRSGNSAYPTTPRNKPSPTLYIGNLSYQMSDKDLSDLFRDIKGVTDVRVAIDRRSGQPRGFSHADFTDSASASAAMKILQGKEFYGRSLRVDFAAPPELNKQD